MVESNKKCNKYFIDIRPEKFYELLKKSEAYHQQVLKAQKKVIPDFFKKLYLLNGQKNSMVLIQLFNENKNSTKNLVIISNDFRRISESNNIVIFY